eukprot:g1684.t1
MLLYGVGASLMPLSLFRYHCVLGPTAYGFAWLASLIASIVSVFVLMKDVYVLGFFGGVCFLYVIVFGVFLALLRKNTWHTFFFSTVSWKETLEKEFLKDRFAGSMLWNERMLLGDEDANYAALIAMYCDRDLPWGKLEEWLQRKKVAFGRSPPVWMSTKWISLIPKERRGAIWNTDEFSALLDVVGKVEKEFARQLLTKRIMKSDQKMKNVREKSKRAEKSNPRDGKSGNEDSSSKEKPETRNSRITGENNSDIPASETLLSKGKRVDQNLNPEQNYENRESGEKQKEKPPENKSSLDAIVKQDTSLMILSEPEHVFRKRAKSAIEKRKSSFEVLTGGLSRPTEAKDILQVMTVPEELTRLLSKAALIKLKDIRPAADDSLNGGIAKCMIENGEESKIIPTILCAVLRQLRQMGKEDKKNSGVLRTAIAGFFEVADEVSDIILAGIFYSEAGDVLWAAHLMFVFMGLNRFMQFAVSLAVGQSFLSALEGLIGVKCITDTYRMIRDGASTLKGGQQLAVLRASSLLTGIIYESFPQMMLQVVIVLSSLSKMNTEVNAGILIAQLASVTVSCASIGFSIASLTVDNALSLTTPGQEKHISAYKYIPRENMFRQMIVLLSLTLITALHVILAVFGFGALVSFAPAEVSVPILIGNIIIMACLRYWAQDVGIYGLDLWKNQSSTASCYQPWDKIEEWLNDKKVWKEPGELDRLLKKVEEAMEKRD